MDHVSSTQEFQAKNKREICKTKSPFLDKTIQVTKLSAILQAELTSKGKGLERFWNESSKELSKKLWLPQQTDFHVLAPTNSSNGYLRSLERDLSSSKKTMIDLQTKNSQTICSKLSQFSPTAITEDGNIVTRKIRFYPNEVQVKFLNDCFGQHRYHYNKCVDYYRTHKKAKHDFRSLRNQVVMTNILIFGDNKWMNRVPIDTRSGGVQDFAAALEAARSNKKNGNITHFKMKFKRKRGTQVCHFNKKALRKGFNLCKNTLKKDSKLRFTGRTEQWLYKNIDPKNLDGAFSIYRNSAQQYYLLLVVKPEIRKYSDSENDTRKPIVALDPGEKIFQTFYSETEVGTLGYEFTRNNLDELHKKEDKFKKLIKNAKGARTRRHMKRRCALLRTKAKNRVKDLHWQSANFLTKNYKVILLPKFDTQRIVQKLESRITNRRLMAVSHFAFRNRIIHKAKKNHSEIILCSEAYTTQTCGGCGLLSHCDGNRIHNCSCGLSIDRDVNGARNVFLRSLTKYFEDGDGASS